MGRSPEPQQPERPSVQQREAEAARWQTGHDVCHQQTRRKAVLRSGEALREMQHSTMSFKDIEEMIAPSFDGWQAPRPTAR
jgi:hypothetical protein